LLEGQSVTLTATATTAVPQGTTYTIDGEVCGNSSGCQPLYETHDSSQGTNVDTLGTLLVTGTGSASATFISAAAQTVPSDSRLNMNGSMVDFGPIRTDGMISLQEDATTQPATWTVRAWPRFARLSTLKTPTIEIDSATIAMPSLVSCHTSPLPGATSDIITSVTPTYVNAAQWEINLTAGAKYCTFGASGDLVGSGVTAAVSTGSLAFPTTSVGSSSSSQPIVLTNTSTSTAMAIGTIVASGNNSSSFQVSNTCGSSLAANASCQINVTFVPTASGNLVANVIVTDSAGNSPQQISLSGTGGAVPTVSLSSLFINFDDLGTGVTSAAQSVTLTNSGNGALTISGISLGTTTPTPPIGTTVYAESTTCGTTLAAGASCLISATFTPQGWTTYSNTVTITSNASSSPDAITLTGTGIPEATITFNVANQFLGVAPFTVAATSTVAGAFTYSVVSGPATISGSTVTLTGVGTVVLQAMQPASGKYGIGIKDASFTVTSPQSSQSIWVVNANGTLSEFDKNGTALSLSGGYAGGGVGIGIDNTGNVWSANSTANTLSEVTPYGSSAGVFSGGGLSGATALAIDGSGEIWVTNNNGLSVFSNGGSVVSPASGYTGLGLSGPSAVAIDAAGDVWVANSTSSTVTEFFGAADPVVTPTAAAVKTGSTGVKP
jgi:hypothetical protein